VILRTIAGLAEPPRSTTAVEFFVTSSDDAQVGYNSNEPGPAPTMISIPQTGPRTPVAGSHAVMSHSICGGDEALQALRVVQSVMTTNTVLDTANLEYIQKFRVPEDCILHWVELAFPLNNVYTAGDGQLSIYDAEGQGTPPQVYGTPLASAGFYASYGSPATWQSHFDFSSFPGLVRDHDYWLVVNNSRHFPVYAKNLNGSESADFTSRIGPLFRRPGEGAGAVTMPNRALDFRLIAEPAVTTGVLPPTPGRGDLRLAVTPNPSRGAARVRWTGAAGALRIDVLDARGRRVAHAENAPGDRGQWVWNGRDDAGRALPAAVYFLRATDDAGRVATGRVVWVR
jgi:hypothetical protein